MKKHDFKHLPQEVQQNYEMKKKAHEMMEAKIQQEVAAANAGFIPSGGYGVKCDFYLQTDTNDPTKTKRAVLPSEAIQWLIDRLAKQGSAQDQMKLLPPAAQAEIGQLALQQPNAAQAGIAPPRVRLRDQRQGCTGLGRWYLLRGNLLRVQEYLQ